MERFTIQKNDFLSHDCARRLLSPILCRVRTTRQSGLFEHVEKYICFYTSRYVAEVASRQAAVNDRGYSAGHGC